MPVTRPLLATLAIAAVALPLAACGGGDDTPEYCDLREEAATQLQVIRDTNVVREGTDVLRTRVETALDTFGRLSDQAADDFPEETTAVSTSIDSLRASLDQLGVAGQRSAALAALPGQLRTAADSMQALRASVDATCTAE